MNIPLDHQLTTGVTIRRSLIVEPEHTAPHVGSGTAPVLATPILVNLFEAAALALVENRLPPGTQTLGTRLDIHHTAATPVGMEVSVSATLVNFEGRKLYFELEASDAVEQIGHGSHVRVVVDIERFDQRVQDKARALHE